MDGVLPDPKFTDDLTFQSACRKAVEESAAIGSDLRRTLEELARWLQSDAAELRRRVKDVRLQGLVEEGQIRELITRDGQLVADIVGMLRERSRQRLDHLGTFNITLFGRTGVGKSSLMTALTRKSGKGISTGESDCTTKVTSEVAGKCLIADTPGTDGWGRTKNAGALRADALRALAASDIVVLCFDSHNRRDTEFKTIAEWVTDHGKPAVAVLNVKHSRWRRPARVSSLAERRQASRTVAQHVDDAAEGLAAIGLGGTPLIALSAKNAAFARARQPYRGPDAQGREVRLREAGGSAGLLALSNFGVLERLLIEAIKTDAVALRLSSVFEDVRATVRRAAEEFDVGASYAVALAKQAELGIERVLGIMGSPESLESPDKDLVALRAMLGRLEQLRGARINAPVSGAAVRYANELLAARLGPLRLKALRRAGELVDQTMATGRRLTTEQFSADAIDVAEIAAHVRSFQEDFSRYLESHLGMVARDTLGDIRCVAELSSDVRGRRGRLLYWSGVAISTGGLVAGTSALFAVGIVNAWNPLGWSALAVGAALVIGGAALDVLGRWARKRAARKREQQQGNARADTRHAINEAFDRLMADMNDSNTAILRAAMTTSLRQNLVDTIVLREIATADRERHRVVTDFLETVPAAQDPSKVLRTAALRCERAYGVGRRLSRRDLWLGESWLTMPEGLDDAVTDPQESVQPPWSRDDVTARMNGFFAALANGPRPGSGREWLSALSRKDGFADDPGAAGLISHLTELARASTPRVVLCGDFNAGKSSLIARLLQDADLAIPRTLETGGQASTREATDHLWRNFLVIDTPGLQSRNRDHQEKAMAALEEAALVIYMLTPGGLGGDLSGIAHVVRSGKAGRTIFALGRIDDMGIDPEDSPAGFTDLCRLKEQELMLALRRLGGGELDDPTVISIAPAPYENVAQPARWDGIAEFTAALTAAHSKLAKNAPDLSVLGSAVSRLTALAALAEAEAEGAAATLEQLIRLAQAASGGEEEARTLKAGRQAILERIITDFLDGLIERLLHAGDKNTRAALLHRLVHYGKDGELTQRINEWQATTKRQIGDLIRDLSASLSRQSESAVFARPTTGFADIAGRVDGTPFRTRRARTAESVAGRIAGALGRLDKAARAAPLWSRLAPVVRVAGPAATLAGLGLTAFNLVDDIKNRDKRERARTAAIQRAHRSAHDASERFCRHDPGMRALDDYIVVLQKLIDDTESEHARVSGELAARLSRRAAHLDAIASARTLLQGGKP